MHRLETSVGTFETLRGRVARKWRVARRLAAAGSCVALLVAAFTVRLTAADAVPAAAGREPAGVRVDTAAGWGAVAWASDLNTRQAHMDAAGEHPRFAVEEPGKRGVWLKALNPPVNPADHPVLVLKYRARNIAATRYAIWLDDGTGPNNGKGVWAIDSGELVADGQVHEIRRDLSQPGRPGLPTAGPFDSVALGVSAKPGEKAWLDLVDLRFEVAAPEPPAPPRPATTAPAAADPKAGGEPARWEYAALRFERPTKYYVWEAGGTRVPESNYANVDSLHALVTGLGGQIPPKRDLSLVDALNTIGRDGWELAGIESSPDERTHVFKRRAK